MPRRHVRFDIATATVMTRAQALEQHVVRYYTGKPCNRGHLTYRYTSTGGCAQCLHPEPTWHQRGDAGIQYNVSVKVVAPMEPSDWPVMIRAVQRYVELWSERKRLLAERDSLDYQMRRAEIRLAEPEGCEDYVKDEDRGPLLAVAIEGRTRLPGIVHRLATLDEKLDL